MPKNNNDDEELYKFAKKGPSIFSIILIISLIFFVSAAAFAFFFLAFNKNEVKNEVIVSLTGPNSVKSGEVLDFLVKMENPTELDYKDIEFFIEYPKSTIDADTKEFITNKTVLYDKKLLSGGSIEKEFSSILSGAMGDVRDIQITIFYKVGEFSNTLISKRAYTVEINSAPVSIEMEYPEEVLSNKEFILKVNILSNTDEVLKDLIIVSKYPSGFKVLGAKPAAVFSNTSQNVFKINELKVGEKEVVEIRGILNGQNNENKFFSFELGDSVPYRNEIRTLFSKTEKEIAIKRPDINLIIGTNFDNQDGEALVAASSTFNIRNTLQNNLSSVMSDLEISADFDSNIILKNKVKVEKGFYDSNNNKIV